MLGKKVVSGIKVLSFDEELRLEPLKFDWLLSNTGGLTTKTE